MAGLGLERAHPQMRSHSRRVCQRDERVIVDVDARAAAIELSVHVVTGPKSTTAWSMRCVPMSKSRPPASSGASSSRQLASGTGRQRLKRDSKRSTRPSRPAATNWQHRENHRPSGGSGKRSIASGARMLHRSHAGRQRGIEAAKACPQPREGRRPTSIARAGNVDLGEAMTAMSRSVALANISAALANTLAAGYIRAACSRRDAFDVTIAAITTPGVAAMTGAWKAAPRGRIQSARRASSSLLSLWSS